MSTLDEMEMPTLTFDPAPEPEEKAPVVPVQEEKAKLDDSMLNDKERQMVESFAKQIDLHNTNGILQYGAGTQKKMADFSEKALENVKTKDLGSVGDMLTNVVTELKSFDAQEEEKGFFSFLKKPVDKITSMKTKYDKVETNVEKICTALEDHQTQLMKDVAMLDRMYEQNLLYFKELSMYILAGKKKIDQVKKTELVELIEKADRTKLPEDAQAVYDLNAMIDRFEKKIHDLELTRMISIQMAPQIRLVQNNDTLMSEKIQSTLVNTIPLWKSQMVLALGVSHSEQASKAQREVTDMTNELLKKNAEKLKLATIETAKESERSIVDIETLQATNQSLISTLDEVMTIQQEGRKKRMEAELELNRIEGELKNKLLSMAK